MVDTAGGDVQRKSGSAENGNIKWARRERWCVALSFFFFQPFEKHFFFLSSHFFFLFLSPCHLLFRSRGPLSEQSNTGLFIIPLKWSTFAHPTYVCSFKITMAARFWMEAVIHLLRHSVAVKWQRKHPGLWKVAPTCEGRGGGLYKHVICVFIYLYIDIEIRVNGEVTAVNEQEESFINNIWLPPLSLDANQLRFRCG